MVAAGFSAVILPALTQEGSEAKNLIQECVADQWR
jgi:hypothetical protein